MGLRSFWPNDTGERENQQSPPCTTHTLDSKEKLFDASWSNRESAETRKWFGICINSLRVKWVSLRVETKKDTDAFL